jgi:hypothetical protein
MIGPSETNKAYMALMCVNIDTLGDRAGIMISTLYARTDPGGFYANAVTYLALNTADELVKEINEVADLVGFDMSDPYTQDGIKYVTNRCDSIIMLCYRIARIHKHKPGFVAKLPTYLKGKYGL